MNFDNPYAAPQAAANTPVGSTAGFLAWQGGDLLIVGPKADFPDRCVKCNAPAAGYKKRIRLSWHTPLAFLGLLGGLLPYIIVALVLTKRMTVHVGVCPDHVRKRRVAMMLTTLGAFAGLAMIVIAAVNESGVMVLAAIAVLIVTLIYGIVATRIVWPKRIESQLAWVKGVCPEYLAALPDYSTAVPSTGTTTGKPR